MPKRKNNLPTTSIIIVNYNGEKFIKTCLNSILAEKSCDCEIIVVENGSKDKSLEILNATYKGKKQIKIIPLDNNLGPAKARNIGVKQSKGKYLVFLDCDTEVSKNWVTNQIKYLERHPNIGAGQLKILRMDKREYFDSIGEKLTSFGFLAERARGAKDIGQFEDVENIFSGKTAAMIVRKDVFEKVSGFDEDLFMYWEEPDLCWRIWKAGFRVVYLPMGKIWHAYGTPKKKVSKKRSAWITYQGCRNQITVIFINGVGTDLVQMMAGSILSWTFLLIMFLIKLDFAKAESITKAFAWLAKNLTILLRKRKKNIQKFGGEFYSDKAWFEKVKDDKGVGWYLGKGISYIFGKPF